MKQTAASSNISFTTVINKARSGHSNPQWVDLSCQQEQLAKIRTLDQLIISDDSCWKKSFKPVYESNEAITEEDRGEDTTNRSDLSKKKLILGEINTMKGLKMIINQRLKTLDENLKRIDFRKPKKEVSMIIDQSQENLLHKFQPRLPVHGMQSKSSRHEMLRNKVEALFSSSNEALEDTKSTQNTGLHRPAPGTASPAQYYTPAGPQSRPHKSATTSAQQASRSAGPVRYRPQTDLKVVPLNINNSLNGPIRERRANSQRQEFGFNKDTLVAVEFLPEKRVPISTKLLQMKNPFKQNEILLKKDLQLRNLTRGFNQDAAQQVAGSPPHKWQTPQFSRLSDSQTLDKRSKPADRIGGASEQAAREPQQTGGCILIENLDTDESDRVLASSPSEENILQFIKSYY